jgi:hypothetical protein
MARASVAAERRVSDLACMETPGRLTDHRVAVEGWR